MHTSPTFLEVTPSVTGTYTAVVSGYSGSTGSMTFTFARDVTGSLSSTVATKATIAYRGRHDVYTWSAVAGKHVTFDIGATSWQNATAATAAGYLTVYDSNGSYVAQQSATTSATYLEITPSMTGTYTAVVSGYSGSTGSMTFTFARDVTGTLAPATPVTARVSFRGRHTVLSWSATAHQPVTFQISGGTWQDTTAPTAAGYLTVYDPSGGYQGQVYVTTTATSLAITPSASGTYTAVVSGYSGSTGSLVVRLAGG